MILRLGSAQLRQLADQLDAYTALEAAGGPHQSGHTVMRVLIEAIPPTRPSVGDMPVAYLNWWEDGQRYLAEFIDFTPGDAEPLDYHRAQT